MAFPNTSKCIQDAFENNRRIISQREDQLTNNRTVLVTGNLNSNNNDPIVSTSDVDSESSKQRAYERFRVFRERESGAMSDANVIFGDDLYDYNSDNKVKSRAVCYSDDASKFKFKNRSNLISKSSRVGRRKEQRYLHEHDDMLLKFKDISMEELRTLFQVTSWSCFSEIHKDNKLWHAFQPFRCVTEEEEDRLLLNMGTKKNSAIVNHKVSMGASSEERFRCISRRARMQMKRSIEYGFISEIENVIRSFCSTVIGASRQEEIVLQVQVDGSYQRLLTHSIAVYYGLRSFTESDSGEKSIVLTAPVKCRFLEALPEFTVVEYMESLESVMTKEVTHLSQHLRKLSRHKKKC